MPCPLFGSAFVHPIFVVRASMLFKQIVVCKQSYVKNAKLMSVSKFLEMQFFNKTSEFFFANCDVNSLVYRKP